jgi:Flp pilus assembly protein TadD
MRGWIAALWGVASALVLAVTGAVWAGAPGTLQGRIVDEDGNRLTDVEIVITSEASSTPLTATTKKKGTFAVRIPDRSVVYELRCRLEGFVDAIAQSRPSQRDVTFVEVVMTRQQAPPEPAAPASPKSPPMPPPASGELTEQGQAAIAMFNEGVTALQADDQETAMAKFQEAASADPKLPEPHRALAAVAMVREDWATAVRAAERLLQLEPGDLEAMRTVYFASVMLGDVERVTPAARQVLAADPESAEPELMGHAKGLFEQNLFELSKAVLEALTAHRPDLAEAHYLLGMCLNSLGQTERAAEELSTFLELAPGHADAATARSLLQYLR